MTDEEREVHRAAARRAVEYAKKAIQIGDKITRVRCGRVKSTFTFTHWEGVWLCGSHIHDCHPINVYAVNGRPTSFDDRTAREPSESDRV